MNFRELESLIKVADLKSFSKAAHALYLTQPTISGHIRILEQYFDIRLFNRGKRGATLTDAGELVYSYSKKLLDLRREAKEAIEAHAGLIRGKITVGGSTIPGEFILPALFGRFKKEYPGISLFLRVGDTQTICNEVLRGDVDLAVVGARFSEKQIKYVEHYKDEICLVAASDHPLAKKGAVALADLDKYDMVLREEGSATRLLAEKKLATKGLAWDDLKVVANLGSTAAVKEGVMSGVGIAFISRRAVKNELALGLMKEIRVKDLGELKRTFYVAVNRQRTLSPAAKTFLERLFQDKG